MTEPKLSGVTFTMKQIMGMRKPQVRSLIITRLLALPDMRLVNFFKSVAELPDHLLADLCSEWIKAVYFGWDSQYRTEAILFHLNQTRKEWRTLLKQAARLQTDASDTVMQTSDPAYVAF